MFENESNQNNLFESQLDKFSGSIAGSMDKDQVSVQKNLVITVSEVPQPFISINKTDKQRRASTLSKLKPYLYFYEKMCD